MGYFCKTTPIKQCELCKGYLCLGCDDSLTKKCRACREKTYRSIDQEYCRDRCTPGEYPEPVSVKISGKEFGFFQCIACSLENCQFCLNKDECQTCKDGYFMTEEKKCVSDCGEYKYKDHTDKKCKPCKGKSCKICSEFSCAKCENENLKIMPNRLDCGEECPYGYQIYNEDDQFCEPCIIKNCNFINFIF